MAQVDYFLKVDGVDGESADDKFKGYIELQSFNFGVENIGSLGSGTSGGGTGKAKFGEFNIVKATDKSSARLFASCCTGEHFATATIVCRKAGKDQQEFLKITMGPVLISSFQHGGSANSDIIPTEQISINFAKIEMEYKEQKLDGSLGGAVIGGWDRVANKKV